MKGIGIGCCIEDGWGCNWLSYKATVGGIRQFLPAAIWIVPTYRAYLPRYVDLFKHHHNLKYPYRKNESRENAALNVVGPFKEVLPHTTSKQIIQDAIYVVSLEEYTAK